MKKIAALFISFFIGIALFLWVLDKIGIEALKAAFAPFSLWQGLVILAVSLLMALCGTWKWKEILKGEGEEISMRDLIKPYLAGFSVMFLASIMVFVGEVFRAYSLKEKNSIPWSKGMASVIIDRVFEWTSNLTIVLFGMLFFLFNIGLPPENLAIIFGITFLAFVLVIAYFYIKVFKKESLIEVVMDLIGGRKLREDHSFFEIEKEMFAFFKLENSHMWKSLALSYLRAAIMFLRVWLLIIFLGKSAGFLAVLSILGFSYLAAMTPIPTSLGSHEALQAFSFEAFGLGLPASTAFTMIMRGADVIIALAGIAVLFHLSFQMINNFVAERIKIIQERIERIKRFKI